MKQKRVPPNDSYPANYLTPSKSIQERLTAVFRVGTLAYEKQVLHNQHAEDALFSYIMFSKNAISALVPDASAAATLADTPGLVRYVKTTTGRPSLISYMHHPSMISYFRSKRMFRDLVLAIAKHNWIRASYRPKQNTVEALLASTEDPKWEQDRRQLIDSLTENAWSAWKEK